MKYPTPKINDKLIRRAALKYRKWMETKSANNLEDNQWRVTNRVDRLISRVAEVDKWSKLFFVASGERIQTNPYGDEKPFRCIADPKTHDHIVTKMIPDLGDRIISEAQLTVAMLKNMVKTNIKLPSQVEIVKDIRIIADRWETKFRGGILSVLIPDVTVEDEYEEVNLGNFWIDLYLDYPLRKPTIRSVNEISSEGAYYHPHVKYQELCVGEGADAINSAIHRGDLEYYFDTIESILRTYNSGSPHEELRQWYDPNHENQSQCESCETWVDNEYIDYCEGCNITKCESCNEDGGMCCNCSECMCGNCCTSCEGCGETVCDGCQISCKQCKNFHCENCIGSCFECYETCCDGCSYDCVVCANRLCEGCSTECGCCNKECCSDCLNGKCEHCNKDICSECKSRCDDCEVSMCSDCNDEHSCLLVEV